MWRRAALSLDVYLARRLPQGAVGVERSVFPVFFSPDGGCCPALGRGRLPAGGRGQGLAQPLAPYDPQPRVGAATSDGQHGNARRTIGLLSAARQRAFGLPLSRARAGRASVRRRSFRPFRGGDLLRVLPRLRQQAESLFLPCKRGVIP